MASHGLMLSTVGVLITTVAKGTLVMMVKRGNSFIVPNGQLELRPGDILLTIAQQKIRSKHNFFQKSDII